MLSKISSITGYLVALAGLVYLIYNGFIFSENIVIIIVQILSFGLMIWARMILKFRSFHLTSDITEGRLVTKGPYKWFRHPIYAAVIYFSSSCLFAFPRIEVFIAFIFIASGLFLRMILEEKELKQKYPEYIEYSKKAKRIIPYVY